MWVLLLLLFWLLVVGFFDQGQLPCQHLGLACKIYKTHSTSYGLNRKNNKTQGLDLKMTHPINLAPAEGRAARRSCVLAGAATLGAEGARRHIQHGVLKMRAVLAHTDLDDALERFGGKNVGAWSDDEKRKDRKALSQIHLHLSNNILQEVLKETTTAALWLKLEQLCMTKDLTSKMHLKQKLFLHKLRDRGKVMDHLSEFKEIIADLKSMETVQEGGSVLMGDNTPHKIAGIGSIQIKMADGIIRTLTDVRHISTMTRNLISLSTLDLKGYKYSAEGGVLKVSRGSLVVMKGDIKSANLYLLRGTTITVDS
ncbi:hypothetical protein U9M48_031759 [Paspalum notatum var. saurae]|uniref:Retrovirus-related Pol polyprotein from transposon TNT 1-94 n=1 Tax=Paspalum notatum var. saurae TaxID=547442 RepID=A0AAQ3U4L4_PASNO